MIWGQPLEYISISHEFGHFLESLHRRYDYVYAKFIFKLLSNANFDPSGIFFHFPHSLLSSTTTSISTSALTLTITPTTTSTSTSTWPCEKERQYFRYFISRLF